MSLLGKIKVKLMMLYSVGVWKLPISSDNKSTLVVWDVDETLYKMHKCREEYHEAEHHVDFRVEDVYTTISF